MSDTFLFLLTLWEIFGYSQISSVNVSVELNSRIDIVTETGHKSEKQSTLLHCPVSHFQFLMIESTHLKMLLPYLLSTIRKTVP